MEEVETFVECHYGEQIKFLQEMSKTGNQIHSVCHNTTKDNKSEELEILRLLKFCCADEVHHKEDARQKLLMNTSPSLDTDDVYQHTLPWRGWRWTVRNGSIAAAEISRRI